MPDFELTALLSSCSHLGIAEYVAAVVHNLVVAGFVVGSSYLRSSDEFSMLTSGNCGVAFQILRVYAISGRRWQLAVVVAVLVIFPSAIDMVRPSV